MIPDRWLLLDYPWDLLAFVAIAALVRREPTVKARLPTEAGTRQFWL